MSSTLRYVKLLREYRMTKGAKAAQFRECLSNMSQHGDDSSFYAYTTEWIATVNRGGLVVVNDNTFKLFKAMKLKTREILPQHLARSGEHSPEDILQAITLKEAVQQFWREVTSNDSDELLRKIVEMWVSMQGFSIMSAWMEEYKNAKGKLVKKSKSLREELYHCEDWIVVV